MEVIVTHLNADFDSLGSMIAAKKLYPEAKLVFPGAQEKSLRDFLVRSTLYILESERLKDVDLGEVRRLIVVDTRQRSRIGKFVHLLQRPEVEIHIYDHHPPSPDDFHGHLEVVEERGANTTIMTRLLRERGIEITPEEATVMMLGIYEDTGSFTYPSTTEADFQEAGYLLSCGADLRIVS
ncbi:MAG: polya polymerase, partial [Deltaproteobacteria bacterium]